MRTRNRLQCSVPGCREAGTNPTPDSPWFGLDVCERHTEARAVAARAAWVDPAGLVSVHYDGMAPRGYYSENPCNACGHPWFAHCRAGYYDGPCVLPECVACDGSEGHSPGYLPGIAG